MNLKQNAERGPAVEEDASKHERFLTLLVEGAAQSMPEVESGAYQEFRSAVSAMISRIPERMIDQEKLFRIREILQQFERYRCVSETAQRERLTGWRNLAGRLLRELLGSMGIDAASASARVLVAQAGCLMTAEDIRCYQEQLDDFLRPCRAEDGYKAEISQLKVADHSTANTNAAGLRGGGAAVEQVSRILQRGGRGFVVLFRLGCLEMIHERFGLGAVEDCLMSVSAYLMQSLHSDDTIYHWSDSSLLAILQGRPNEQILTGELHRIVAHIRDITISVSGRTIMIRLPVQFSTAPISRMREPDDLFRFSQEQATSW